MQEGRILTTVTSLEKHFEGEARMRIALVTWTHSPCLSRLFKSYVMR